MGWEDWKTSSFVEISVVTRYAIEYRLVGLCQSQDVLHESLPTKVSLECENCSKQNMSR